jgi:thiol-disulfide isomerase/thioredoxin
MIPLKRSLGRNMSLGFAAAGLVAATWSIAAAQEPGRNFIVHDAPKPITALQFENADGQSRSLTDFRGKVVLLNIWATWCVPCRKEMPTLDRLQARLGGAGFEVVALSIDHRIDAVRKFFTEVGIQKLAMHLDSSAKATRELGAVGLPTTLLIDREGREVGRLIGPAEWDSPEMIEFVSCVIASDGAAQTSKELAPAASPPCRTRRLDVPAVGTDSNRQP